MIKVTVYIPTYNYGKFIDQAIQSIKNQTMDSWELIIIDDGSVDNTIEVLDKYRNDKKIRIIQQENKGLNVTNNIALRLANGRYIMRLDADDYLDENALLILSNILDTKPQVDLVYPDYYEVDVDGKVLHQVRRKKVGKEVELLDLPAHGACTMFKKEALLQIGGYMESFSCQDGYELWLRFIQEYKPYNVNIPLFYYRQHPASLTKNHKKILDTRRDIKEQFVRNHRSDKIPKVLGVIPVTRSSVYSQSDPFIELAGKPLIQYTLDQIESANLIDKVVVSTDNQDVIDYVKKYSDVEPIKRDKRFSTSSLKMQDLLKQVLDQLSDMDYTADAVCTLYINTPLRKGYHIDKTINTMAIFDVDTVISVQEELAHCYHHRRLGLEPINNSHDGMRIERQAVYKENSAIFLNKVDVINSGRFLGNSIGHIVMLPEESIKISSQYDLWLCENILRDWQKR